MRSSLTSFIRQTCANWTGGGCLGESEVFDNLTVLQREQL